MSKSVLEAEQIGESAQISHEQRQFGMRCMVWDGVLCSVMIGLTGGVFLTGFALMVGASETIIGILSALPRLSSLMQPLGSYFVERFRVRKTISVWVFGPARALWLLIVFLPLMGYAGGASRFAMSILIAVALASAVLGGFAQVSWLSWMADLIPERTRGEFFGRRNMLAGGTSAVVGFLAGKFVDLWRGNSGQDDPWPFLLVFLVGIVCGLGSWWALVRCPEPRIRSSEDHGTPRYMALVREAWADRNFRQLLYFAAVVWGGVMVAGPFFTVYMIRTLEMPYTLMAVCTGMSAVGSLAMVRLWGRLCDHFGNRPVILTCLMGASLVPAFWLLTAGGAWWPTLVSHFMGGASWSGIMLAQMNLVFKIAPEDHRSVYIALLYSLAALPNLVVPVLGGLFLQHTAHWTLDLGAWTYTSFHILFLLSSLVRFASIPIFRRVREPQAKRVVHMIRVLSHFRSLNPILGFHYYSHVVSDGVGREAGKAADALRRTAGRLRPSHHDDETDEDQ